jgi:hypothetical protein
VQGGDVEGVVEDGLLDPAAALQDQQFRDVFGTGVGELHVVCLVTGPGAGNFITLAGC